MFQWCGVCLHGVEHAHYTDTPGIFAMESCGHRARFVKAVPNPLATRVPAFRWAPTGRCSSVEFWACTGILMAHDAALARHRAVTKAQRPSEAV